MPPVPTIVPTLSFQTMILSKLPCSASFADAVKIKSSPLFSQSNTSSTTSIDSEGAAFVTKFEVSTIQKPLNLALSAIASKSIFNTPSVTVTENVFVAAVKGPNSENKSTLVSMEPSTLISNKRSPAPKLVPPPATPMYNSAK